jgi:pimeloyl-ACP methyl ester carboxylesterase
MPGILERAVVHAGIASRALEVEGDGPTVLLLHGFTDSADTWRPLLRELARRGRRAIAVDLPSHGRADSLLPDHLAVPQLVDFAHEASIAAGPGTIVVGNSLGGMVALLVAERHPAPGGVVPIGPAAFEHPRWLSIVLDPRLLDLYAAFPAASHCLGFSFVGLLSGMPVGYLRTYWSHLRRQESRRRLRALARQLNSEARTPYDHTRLCCPVLLLWGDLDWFALPRGARQLLAAHPETRHEVLRWARHCPQHQIPARIADLICAMTP